MKIEYIHHSAYVVEFPEVALIFDYFAGELPEVEKEKQIFVFASHRHGDHFSKKIFSLTDTYKNIKFILSDDINKSVLPKEIEAKAIFMPPNTQRYVKGSIPLNISTYKSTDEGVAFLIDICNTRIYYAGDLNYWYWSGESKEWNESQRMAYSEEMTKLASCVSSDGKQIDVAFIPIDMRLGEYYYLGLKYYMDMVGSKYIFPMHLNGDFSKLSGLRSLKEISGYIDKIFMISKENEKFEVLL